MSNGPRVSNPSGCMIWLDASQSVIAPVKMIILIITTGFHGNIGSGFTAINRKWLVPHLKNGSTGSAVSVCCRITRITRCLDALHGSF